MKHRQVIIFSGHVFSVPQCVQRIDTRSTHGWQVRYQGTKFFADGSADGSGAAQSLLRASKELARRMEKHTDPVTFQTGPSIHKTSDLPSGISGPIVRQRSDSGTRCAEFSLVLPRFGQLPRRRTVYIATENTYSIDKYNTALAKAVKLREDAESRYQLDAAAARRKRARVLRASIRESADHGAARKR
jgi:hypothetical protein